MRTIVSLLWRLGLGLLFGLAGCEANSGYRQVDGHWAHNGNAFAPEDAATFKPLDELFARDARRGYYRGSAVDGSDVASFEPLAGDFAHDALRGYHGASFAIVDARDPDYARDRAHVHHGHRELNTPNQGPHPVLRTLRQADPETLRALGRGYAGDATHVWHRGELMAGVDAPSFEVDESYVGESDARDRLGRWQAGRRLAPEPVPTTTAEAGKAP